MTDDDFSSTLSGALRSLGVSADAEQVATLRRHYGLLLEANARFNLTRITDPGEAAVRLYADSAAVLPWAKKERLRFETILDVGTGAGFPALPLAVLAPRCRVTALEATAKKAVFVEQAAAALSIDNLRSVHAHSDHWSADPKFNLVTFKAVGSLEACLETAGKLVSDSGYVVVFKSAGVPSDEVHAGVQAARRLGFTQLEPFDYELPSVDGSATFALYAFRKGKG